MDKEKRIEEIMDDIKKAVLYAWDSGYDERMGGSVPIKWVIDEQRNGDRAIRCSSCGAVVEDEEWADHNYYYCYHCGGKAENPQEPLAVGRRKG